MATPTPADNLKTLISELVTKHIAEQTNTDGKGPRACQTSTNGLCVTWTDEDGTHDLEVTVTDVN